MPRPIRRVVTGHNAQGKAVFIADGPAPAVYDRGPGATAVTELWETRATPASNAGNADPTVGRPAAPAAAEARLEIPRRRVSAGLASGSRPCMRHSSAQDANAKSEGYVRDVANKRHPGFHKTATIDYAIVLSGEIYALMDEGELLLKTGDVLIQRGTNHAWSNRTNEPCSVAFVLIDADPV